MPARVLVVDDQEDVLTTLVRFLQLGGYDVSGVTDFNEAKRRIDTSPPDILVTDVRLGAYNGLHLALHMRNARADAPIVVLSAWDDPTLRQEALALGASYHLKPINKRDLLGAVAAGSRHDR